MTLGAAIDPSDRNAADLYITEHPNSQIEIRNTYNNVDPKKAPVEFKQAMDENLQFFVNTQASSHAVECLSLFESDRALSINISATSTRLSDRDDYFLRLIPDLRREQIAVARSVARLPGRRLLVLQDTSNLAYTDPALNVFRQELARHGSFQLQVKRFRFTDYQPSQLQAVLEQPFDGLYVLGGSFLPSIGNMAQQFHHAHPQAAIMLTPWARSAVVLSHSGLAADRILQSSPYPDVTQDQKLRSYLDRFKRRFGYEPYAMSIGTRQALELLDQAFARGHRSPKAVKSYILSKPVHHTSLGPIRLNRFGDSQNQLYIYPLVTPAKDRALSR
ncbi:MAG: ABC transporter substrate-binding protein [Synechococcaceae cyanobacterium]|nr:ABC transporter substrate-binding protein [Synechococcaceae cyanobacterium]